MPLTFFGGCDRLFDTCRQEPNDSVLPAPVGTYPIPCRYRSGRDTARLPVAPRSWVLVMLGSGRMTCPRFRSLFRFRLDEFRRAKLGEQLMGMALGRGVCDSGLRHALPGDAPLSCGRPCRRRKRGFGAAYARPNTPMTDSGVRPSRCSEACLLRNPAFSPWPVVLF